MQFYYRFPRLFCSFLAPLILAGCGSARLLVHDEEVNVRVGSKEEIIARYETLAARIATGEKIGRAEALRTLGVRDDGTATIEELRRPDMQTFLFGNALILERDTALLSALDQTTGVRIPFVDRKEHVAITDGIYETRFETGHDFAIIILFDRGLIRTVSQIGLFAINRTTRSIFFSPIGVLSHAPVGARFPY
jgi:hypothetical protein